MNSVLKENIMKPTNLRKSILILSIFLFMLGSFLIPSHDVFSQTGTVVASTAISNSTPEIGDQITVTVSIDMSAVNSPDNKLGSYTVAMQWNTSVLSYVSYSGAPPTGFTGVVNAANAATGKINFNGANAAGASGVTVVIAITFNVIGAGNALLDLDFTAMAAATTFNNLLGILTINKGAIVVEGDETGVVELDSVVSSGTANNTSSLSFSHTTGTGDNRMTLVGISWNAGTSAKTINSVKFRYGAGPTEIAFTEVITETVTVSGSVSGPRYAAIYRSSAQPPAGIAGTMTVTFSTTVENGVVAGAANFKGVDQTTPLGTALGAHATSTSSSPSLTLTGLSGKELIFDTVFLGGQDNTYNLTVGADQSQHWNNFEGNTRGAASTEQAAGTSATMSWTPTTQNWWAQVAVPINPIVVLNQAPTLNPVGNKSIIVGSTLGFTATAYDDGLPSGMLIFSLEGGLSGSVPAGAQIVATTGIFSWTPATVGSSTFDVCVSDGALKDCETITVNVIPNIPPPTQSSFYGEIHYQSGDGEPSVGDFVEAHIAGIPGYVNRTAILDTGNSLAFSINVDGDDLGTSEKDGGIQNDLVIFMINGRVVAKGTWLDMVNTEINIHPPKADAGGAYAVLLEDASIDLAASITDWLMPDAFTYEWDFNEDGDYDDATGQTPTFAFTEAGTHGIKLKVSDGQGGEGFDQTALFVVELEGLENQFYNGNPHPVTVTGVDAPYTTTILYGDPLSTIPPTLTGTYPVVVQIKQGDVVIAVIEVELVIAGAIHEIDLVAGWNLISYNVTPTSSDIGAVLASIVGSYSLVYAWDVSGAHNNTGNWVRFDPSVPYGNTLTTLDVGMGFWIFMEEADVLTVIGTYQTVRTIPLKISVGGWNLVGYPSADNLALPWALSDNGVTDFSLIYAYKAADTSDPWKLFDPTVAPVLNDLTQMSPGWGYWIFVTEDSDWQVAY